MLEKKVNYIRRSCIHISFRLNRKLLVCLPILVIVFSSCQTPKNLKNTSYTRAKENFAFTWEELTAVNIDTTALYQLHATWTGPYNFDAKVKKNYTKVKDVKDVYGNAPTSTELIKFNNTGMLTFFYVSNDLDISKELLNEESKLIGVYDIYKGTIYTKRFMGIGHGPQLIRGKAKVKEDTLHLIEKAGGVSSHSYYRRVVQ